jgi:hypothetical protein
VTASPISQRGVRKAEAASEAGSIAAREQTANFWWDGGAVGTWSIAGRARVLNRPALTVLVVVLVSQS